MSASSTRDPVSALACAFPLVVLIAKTSYRFADRRAALDPALLWWFTKPSEADDRRKLSRPTGVIDGRETKVHRGFLPTELFEILTAHGETAVTKKRVEPVVLALRHHDDVLVRVVLSVRVNVMGCFPMLERAAKKTLRDHAMEELAVT